MARASVPQFGEWENEDNVPYTVYFDKARQNKGAKIINPNDPQENPEMFANAVISAPPSRLRAPQEEPIGHGSNKTARQQRENRDDGEYRQFADSPARYRNGGKGGRAVTTESPHHQYGGRGTGLGRPSRPSVGSEHSIDRSPLHPQAKLSGRGNGSPFLEGKRSIEAPNGTPGRSRIKPKTRDEATARDVIPQFGDWDVNDPQSADNFTYIFGQNAKGASSRDANSAASPYNSPQRRTAADGEKLQSCCFPWGKK